MFMFIINIFLSAWVNYLSFIFDNLSIYLDICKFIRILIQLFISIQLFI